MHCLVDGDTPAAVRAMVRGRVRSVVRMMLHGVEAMLSDDAHAMVFP